MTDEQHIHELIDQYLMGELMGQELDKFKIRLKDDPDFLREVQIQKAIIQSLEVSRKAELKALIQKETKRKGFIIPFGQKPLAIAATLLSLLAFGLVLKTVLPNIGNQVAQSDQSEEDKPEIDRKKTTTPEVVKEDVAPDEQEKAVPPEQEPAIELAEVVQDDEVVTDEETDVLLSNNNDLDISQLQKDEDQIDGKDVTAQRDTMLGSKTITLLAYNYGNLTTTRETTSGSSAIDNKADDVQVESKKETRRDRRKNKNLEEVEEADEVDKTQPVLNKTASGSVKVEFWHSIVNFKGYKFNGSKLLLFDTPQDIALQIVTYQNATYLLKGNTWYKLVPNSNFNQLSRLSDVEVLKVLTK